MSEMSKSTSVPVPLVTCITDVKSCPYCGKIGLDFDMPGSPKPCRSPVVYEPGVGGWVCSYSQGKEIAVLQSTRE